MTNNETKSAWEIEHDAKQAEIDAILARMGLTVESVFVPLSQSRNKDETTEHLGRKKKLYSLNWTVTLKQDGRDVVTTDYTAGIAHAPAYKERGKDCEAVRWECETGLEVSHRQKKHGVKGDFATVKERYTQIAANGYPTTRTRPKAIKPETRDVIYALALDCGVIDHDGFEDWAANFGYDADSRKAEAMYRQSLEIALKVRNALGQESLDALRELFQDY
jgi:hypothetical protein